MKAVLILSGGLDSATLGYWLRNQGCENLICITYNYGQRHLIELEAAQRMAQNLKARHHILDISFLQHFLTGSSLTNPTLAMPQGAYSKENMQVTVVPNRNTVLLSIAWSIACTENAVLLAYGAHSGDHYLYPDTRPLYVEAINTALRVGTEDCRHTELQVYAPFIHMKKTDIVALGQRLGVPLADTWSCYEGGVLHCGLCGACQERKKAFLSAKITDPTDYHH